MTLAATQPTPGPNPTIFDNVAAILRERYYDKKFREEQLPSLIENYRPSHGSRQNTTAQRMAAEKLLSKIPASHLGLLSEAAFGYLVDELSGKPRPTFGFQVVRIENNYFTFFVLEEGPAAAAGVQPWERVISIDGVPIAKSARLDWPQKDSFLNFDRDPPIHSILCQGGDEILAVLERTPGNLRNVKLKARAYSALEAARASARLLKLEGRTVGYVHFWFIHSTGVPELLRELFATSLSNAEGLILDLRGRGGNGIVVPDILEILGDWNLPIVALTDRQSRSAKDALAYEFKQRRLATLVGEQTAGAVIPASFAPVGDKTILMFPSFTLGEYTQKLELKGGVPPDVFVQRAGPYAAGKDPIFDRAQVELAQILRDAPRLAQTDPKPAAPTVPAPTPAASAPARNDLPSPQVLIQKMVDALGGEKALRAHSHRTLSGTTELIGLPMKGNYLQRASAPDRSLVVMHLGDMVIRQGFDGNTTWTDTPMTGKKILTGPAADLIRQQTQFYGPLDLPTAYKEINVVGFSTFDGKECIEIKLVGAGGARSSLYVNEQSFLAVGTKTMVDTPVGPVETKTYSRNYRDLDGFRTPTEIYIESSLQRQVIRIEKATFEEIPASEYAPPSGAQ